MTCSYCQVKNVFRSAQERNRTVSVWESDMGYQYFYEHSPGVTPQELTKELKNECFIMLLASKPTECTCCTPQNIRPGWR